MLDLLGVDYEVMGGVGQCCGVYQFREGDFVNNSKMAYATIDGLASAGTSTVLSWCPSCQIPIGEVSLPNYERAIRREAVRPEPVPAVPRRPCRPSSRR